MPVSDQGPLIGRYTLIPRTLVFLTRSGKVLLIKGSPEKRLWANLYNGIGGHVEPGEDVLSAAHREVFEETGLAASDLRLCGTVVVDTGEDVGIAIYVFRGECPTGEWVGSNEGTLEWIETNQLAGLPLVADLTVLLPKVLAHAPEQAPFSGLYRYQSSGEMVISFADQVDY